MAISKGRRSFQGPAVRVKGNKLKETVRMCGRCVETPVISHIYFFLFHVRLQERFFQFITPFLTDVYTNEFIPGERLCFRFEALSHPSFKLDISLKCLSIVPYYQERVWCSFFFSTWIIEMLRAAEKES